MQKNWYIIYTKTKCEKKVAALLTKKKVENFCPINNVQITHFRKNKLLPQPLFNSYVFVFIEENEIFLLKHLENVIGLVYWKGRPAIISSAEIRIIKEFTNNHHNIRLERTRVNTNREARVIGEPGYNLDGRILRIKNQSLKVDLFSLGFTMVVEMEKENSMERKITFGNKELLLQ